MFDETFAVNLLHANNKYLKTKKINKIHLNENFFFYIQGTLEFLN